MIAGPYQFFVYALSSADANRDLGMGVPFIPEHMQGQVVKSATNAAPIVLGFETAHGLSTNDQVFVAGAEGNTATNGFWTITKVDDTHYSLNGSTGNGTYVADSGRAGLSTKKIMQAIWCCNKTGCVNSLSLRAFLYWPGGGTQSVLLFVCNQNMYTTGSTAGCLHPPISQVQRFWFGGRGVVGEALISWPAVSGGTGELMGLLWDVLLINRAFTADVEPTDTYDGKKWHNYTANCSNGSLFLMIP